MNPGTPAQRERDNGAAGTRLGILDRRPVASRPRRAGGRRSQSLVVGPATLRGVACRPLYVPSRPGPWSVYRPVTTALQWLLRRLSQERAFERFRWESNFRHRCHAAFGPKSVAESLSPDWGRPIGKAVSSARVPRATPASRSSRHDPRARKILFASRPPGHFLLTVHGFVHVRILDRDGYSTSSRRARPALARVQVIARAQSPLGREIGNVARSVALHGPAIHEPLAMDCGRSPPGQEDGACHPLPAHVVKIDTAQRLPIGGRHKIGNKAPAPFRQLRSPAWTD